MTKFGRHAELFVPHLEDLAQKNTQDTTKSGNGFCSFIKEKKKEISPNRVDEKEKL